VKDKTSIFKHSGAGTGFYGGFNRTCNHLQKADYNPVEQCIQGN